MNLVTGGAGFLGSSIVAALLRDGQRVRTLDLTASAHAGVESVVGDLCQREVLARACEGVDTVFHSAALFAMHPRAAEALHRVNVGGTERVIAACQEHGVRRLVFTSSIDVVFDGTPIAGGTESLPYPSRYLDAYAQTKARAEQLVLAANGVQGLNSCALRPAGIYGPGDRTRLPRLLEASRSRGLVRIGDGRARFSHVYVDNVAHAHVLAARALSEGSRVSGRAYFVVDAPPQNFFDFVAPFLEQVGVERSSMRVPAWSARSLAWANEWLLRGFGRWLGREPGLTRYAVAATCVDFWFRHDRATADFGYHPIVPLEEAQRRTAEWFRVHARAGDRASPPGRQSVHGLRGSGA